MPNDLLSIVIGNQALAGWTDITVRRGIEQLPSSFNIGLTDHYPGQPTETSIVPGSPCQVKIGPDLVITGYVDRCIPGFTDDTHTIRVIGRGKCQDMVDCSAEWPNNQITNASARILAQKLAEPYGITVTAPGIADEIVPQFNFMWGETAYEVLERACRYLKLLIYDGTDGNLILSRVGAQSAACGFTEGINVQSAEAPFSMDERFSDYVVRRLSMSTQKDFGDGGDIMKTFNDDGVPRHRLRYIVAENGGNPEDIALDRGAWEARRRVGRSMQVHLITDGWRDSAGALWTPNTLVPLDLPSLKVTNKNWIIGEVTYKLDEEGTRAELIIMPPDAFVPDRDVLLIPMGDLRPPAPSTQ
jgi:prophage tail gpP-like protein